MKRHAKRGALIKQIGANGGRSGNKNDALADLALAQKTDETKAAERAILEAQARRLESVND